jgi:hypothetical protein
MLARPDILAAIILCLLTPPSVHLHRPRLLGQSTPLTENKVLYTALVLIDGASIAQKKLETQSRT